MVQALATFLFFSVFTELFIALTLYIVMSVHAFFKKGKQETLL